MSKTLVDTAVCLTLFVAFISVRCLSRTSRHYLGGTCPVTHGKTAALRLSDLAEKLSDRAWRNAAILESFPPCDGPRLAAALLTVHEDRATEAPQAR